MSVSLQSSHLWCACKQDSNVPICGMQRTFPSYTMPADTSNCCGCLVAVFLQLNDVVLEAVVSCSHKTLHYALLLGEQTGMNMIGQHAPCLIKLLVFMTWGKPKV
jgi:hypothetical protein